MPFLIKFSFTTVFGNIEAKKVLGPDYRNFLDLDCYSRKYIEHNSCCWNSIDKNIAFLILLGQGHQIAHGKQINYRQ